MRESADVHATIRTIYYYCSRTAASMQSDYTVVLRSLIRQLSWTPQTSSLAGPVERLYERLSLERPDSGNLSAKKCRQLLRDLLLNTRGSQLIMIVDALDECNEPERLLETLKDLCSISQANIRFIFSSRLGYPGSKIAAYFPELLAVPTSETNSKGDMEVFIRKSVESQKPRLLDGKSPELEERLIKVLSEKAGGM
jgi:hypothetical protein